MNLVLPDWPDYELLDFGQGEKLERFGSVVVRRPAPGAQGPRRNARLWAQAQLVYDRRQERWHRQGRLPDPWLVSWGPLVLELAPRGAGQLGVFPEQAINWQWLLDQQRLLQAPPEDEEDRGLLNLFAYTGGSTLAAAATGAAVAHVDSARSVVTQARRNAQHSSLDQRPIRWLVEDALRFAQRELNRGRRYRAVVLDPPSYGHGTGKRRWQIQRDLPELLRVLAGVSEGCRRLVLLTWHTRRLAPQQVQQMAEEAGLAVPGARWESGSLFLTAACGTRQLWSGYVLRAASAGS